MATETKTFYPGAHEGLTGAMAYSGLANPVGKGSDNSSYAKITVESGGTAYCFWPFDVSAIPIGAEINSVSCDAKAQAYYSTIGNSYSLQLYSGDTAKGTAATALTTSANVFSISGGSWTRSELSSIRIRVYIKKTSGSGNRSIYFYGADLTVTYTYQSEKFMLKLGGAWHDIARVFKKVNGIWVEQTDLANVIEDGVRYQNGGEIISPKKTVTITGSGDATYSYVKINGVTYTSPATIEVSDGDVIEATVGFTNVSTIKPEACCVKVDGQVYVDKGGTHKHTVTSDCTVDLYFYNDYVIYGRVTITTGVDNSSANLITFTIAGTSYQAQEGMTWGEWIASSYNTAGFYVSSDPFGGYVYNKGGTLKVVNPNGFAADPDETIASGYAYTLG